MYNTPESDKELKISEIEHKFKDLDQKILSIDVKITQVVEAILGNSLTKQGGFIKDMVEMKSRIEQLESKIEVQEEFRKKFLWTIALFTAIATVVQFVVHLYIKTKD
jgi:hypothetical protein